MNVAIPPYDASPGEAGLEERFPRSYRRKALILLMLIYVFNFVDRQVVNILAESIKHDLALSDAQLGAITGIAFALLYSVLGLPIARLAEHGDRPKIIAASVGIWSAFTVLCGFAGSFGQMLAARIGVGIGEAGGVPPTHSLITEFTPREERASAIAIYQMGLPLGSLVGLALGGIIADLYGWRVAFFAAGGPGLIFALIALATLREPRRLIDRRTVKQAQPSIGRAISILLAKPTYRWLLLGTAMQSVVAYGVAGFVAPFFLRTHGLELAALAADVGLKPIGYLGLWLGITTGLAGAIGTFFGGWIADHFGRQDLRAYPTVPAIGSLISIPAYLLVFTVPSTIPALLLLAIPSAAVAAWYGPVHGSNQGLVEPRMRATISACTLVVVNLVGLGLGPPLIGMISDHAKRSFGLSDAAGLQAALVTTILITFIAVFAFWQARRTIVADTVG